MATTMNSAPILAQLDALHPTVAPSGNGQGLVLQDIFVIVATGLLLAIALIVWAKYLRKSSKRRRSARHHIPAPEPEETEGETGESDSQRRRRKRRRVLRREHRLRNPTLAETGGLPPKREEEGSPPGV